MGKLPPGFLVTGLKALVTALKSWTHKKEVKTLSCMTCLLISRAVLLLGAIQVLHNAFFRKIDTHTPPRNANNIEPYTFVMLFSGKFYTLPPPLHYVTLEWPLTLIYDVD